MTPKTLTTLSAIAAKNGTSRQSVSKKVKELVREHDLAVERDRAGRIVLVDADRYAELRRQYDHPGRRQRPHARARRKPSTQPADPRLVPGGERYHEMLTEKVRLDVERSRLRLQREQGEVVCKADLLEAVQVCSASLVRHLEAVIHEADGLVIVAVNGGSNALRRALRDIVHRQRVAIADDFAELAGGARPGCGEDGGGEGHG
jgi:hypothetical protein